MLRFQHASGGWGKNIDLARPFEGAQIRELLSDLSGERGSTIDNGATWTELRFLARVFAATGDGELAPAFTRGLDYLQGAQYANGGWPQFHPGATGYRTHITYNDGAMVGVLELLRDVAAGRLPAGLVDAPRRARAEAAVARGIQCILKTQVLVEGKLTAWCAQHDERTLAPAAARSFEPVSLSGGESVGILRFLMGEAGPSAEIVRAVVAGVAWLREMRIDGLRVESVAAPGLPGGSDRVVRLDPAALPLWARFYEIPSGRPLFVGRDGVTRASLAEIEHERRVGYAWYVDWPRRLLEQEFPAWAARHAPDAAPPAPAKQRGE
ncbi:MAG: pectate lyase [Vicinamibacteria bacterium]